MDAQSTRRKVIIDTDAGVDDAQAILLALADPSIDILAITCVGGNTALQNVGRNVLRVLAVAGRLDIPVYAGCRSQIIGVPGSASHYHGEDGLGDCDPGMLPDVDLRMIKTEYASLAIIRLAKENVDQVSIICLAPLTNIAVAIKLDPDFTKCLQSIYIMGGNHSGEGNHSSAAEYNFHHDPEAASIVLEQSECPITMVGWEACTLKSCLFDAKFIEEFYEQDTPQGRFIHDIHRKIMAKLHEEAAENGSEPHFVMCDEWAVAAFLDSRIILESASWPTKVELRGELTRGQCAVDKRWFYGRRPSTEKQVRHVLSLDIDLMKRMLLRMASIDFSVLGKKLILRN